MASGVIIVVGLCLFALGASEMDRRFGVWRADSRVWQTCLIWIVYEVFLAMAISLARFGLSGILSVTSLGYVALGATVGVLFGLYTSYWKRQRAS